MCYVLISRYPCGHYVIATSVTCEYGMHPQLYDPQKSHDVQFITHDYSVNAVHGCIYPLKCPASNFGRPCLWVPFEPWTYAKFCIENEFDITDAVAHAPVWLLDQHGNKVGSKPGPLAVEDYIYAYYAAKNPVSVGSRLLVLTYKAPISPKLGSEPRIFTRTEPVAHDVSQGGAGINFGHDSHTDSGYDSLKEAKTMSTKPETQMENVEHEADSAKIKQEPQ